MKGRSWETHPADVTKWDDQIRKTNCEIGANYDKYIICMSKVVDCITVKVLYWALKIITHSSRGIGIKNLVNLYLIQYVTKMHS